MPFLNLNDLKIYYLDNEKDGCPLLFIHGWLGDSLEWISQLCYFNSRAHIVLLDLPGFGKSDKPKLNYSISFFTENIINFLQILNYNKVIIIGHSMGGIIAQNIALKAPNLVKKLILVSTYSNISRSFKEKISLFFLKLFLKINYKKMLKKILKFTVSNKTSNSEFRKLYKNALKIPKSIVINSFSNLTLKSNFQGLISQIIQPTLLIYGTKDRIVSKNMIDYLHHILSNSKKVEIENGAHRLMIENFEQINKIIDEFIKI